MTELLLLLPVGNNFSQILELQGSEDPNVGLVDVAASWHFLFTWLSKGATFLECL